MNRNHLTMASLLRSIESMSRYASMLILKRTGTKEESPRVIDTLAQSGTDIGRVLGYYADDLIKGSYIERYCAHLTATINDRSHSDMSEEERDALACQIVRHTFADLMGKVMRGVESSSNPMTLVTSMWEMEGNRKLLEEICGVGYWSMTSPDVIDDLFNGMERRARIAEEERRKIVSKVIYAKSAGQYHAIAYNAEGDILDVPSIIPRGVTRKAGALEHVAIFVKAQRESGNQRSILVEHVEG